MVLAPWKEDDEYIKLTRGYQFDPEKDGRLNCNVLDIAKKLDQEIDMSEGEFRDLLKKMFSEIPSYHI